MFLPIEKCNPFIRNAEISPAILEGECPRKAYDHRLFYVLEGSGKIFIENKDYEISNGSLMVIPPAVNYYFKGKMRVILINYDVTRAFDNEKTPLNPPSENLFDEKLIFDKTLAKGFEKTLVIHSCHHLTSDLTDIVSIFNRRDASSDALCSAKLKAVLATIAYKAENTEAHLAAKIKGYITMYAIEIKSNEEIAKHFGYHPVYLEAVFKKETGKTIHTTIVDERIKLSCRWLLNTNATLETIALDTGFSSRAHFCTVFKAKTGLSPALWRKNHSK